MPTLPEAAHSDYESRQIARAREYREGWAQSPDSFKRAAEARGIRMDADGVESDALAFQEGGTAYSWLPDMAQVIDTSTDRIIEKLGAEHEVIVRRTLESFKPIMVEEILTNQAHLLCRVVSRLVEGTPKNMSARVHGLLHALPGLAEEHGFISLRLSAKKCGCSPQAMKNHRDLWLDQLMLSAPEQRTKSPTAIAKYKLAAITNHWRRRHFIIKENALCKNKKTLPLKLIRNPES